MYQTEKLLCFFPRRPEVLGHTLIVGRAHCEDIRDCPAGLGASIFETSQLLGEQYQRCLGAAGFNLMNANGVAAERSVAHLHFHFLPRYADDGLKTWPTLPPFATDLDALLAKVRV